MIEDVNTIPVYRADGSIYASLVPLRIDKAGDSYTISKWALTDIHGERLAEVYPQEGMDHSFWLNDLVVLPLWVIEALYDLVPETEVPYE